MRGSGTRFSPLLEGQPEHGEAPTSPSSSSGLTRGPEDDPRPVICGKVGVGSYEDPGEQKRKGGTKGKTGRPGRGGLLMHLLQEMRSALTRTS